MKQKIFSILFALVLVVSFSLVTVPATAEPGEAEGELVGSYSYSWTTSIMESTDFDFTVGMGWSGPFPYPPNVYFFFHPDEIPLGGYTEPIGGAWLFENIDFDETAAGQTFSVTSVADAPDFNDFSAFLTNGTDETIWLGYIGDREDIASAGGQKSVQESQVFSGTDVGTDFPGWVLRSVSLTFNQIYLDPDNVNKLVLDFTIDIYAGPPTEVWVDDDFTEATTGWGLTHFAAIQPAIDAVAQEGTVNVAAGEYNEAVLIDESLTLQGEDRETTIIKGMPTDPHLVGLLDILADGVNVSGFTIHSEIGTEWTIAAEGDNATLTDLHVIHDNSAGAAIHIGKPYIGDRPVNGFTFTESTMESAKSGVFVPSDKGGSNFVVQEVEFATSWTAVELKGIDGAMVTECSFSTATYPVYISDSGGIEISGNEFVGLARADIAIFLEAYPMGTTVGDVDILGNEISGSTTGIFLGEGLVTAGVSITDNTFQENDVQVLDATETLNIQAVLDTNNFDRAVVIDRPGGSLLHTIWSKIQDAIDGANEDDTILVYPGTYIDDKNGDGDDLDGVFDQPGVEGGLVADIYKSGLTLKSTGGPEVTILRSRGQEGDGVMRIRAQTPAEPTTGVTIDGFTVINTGAKNKGMGILIGGRFAGDIPPEYPGYPASNNIVRNCIVDGCTFGIYLWHTDNNLIENNRVINTRAPSGWEGTGITIWGGWGPDQNAPSRNNMIRDNFVSNLADGRDSYGISVASLLGPLDRDWQPIPSGVQVDFAGTVISGNTITGCKRAGIGIKYVAGAITVTENEIYDNPHGIRILASDGVNIETNEIHDNLALDSGIHIETCPTSHTSSTNIEIRFNNIVNNGPYGVWSDCPVDATMNWWGTRDGVVIATMVSDFVDFDPWTGAGVEDSKSEKTTEEDEVTVDATAETDTKVVKRGTGTPTVTVAKYSDNPGRGFAGSTGKYIDVHVDELAGVDEIEIRLYYTEAEMGGLVESSLRLRWWNEARDRWVVCSDSGVDTTDIAGPPAYSGYMWAKIRDNTTPTLEQLTGAVFGGSGRARARGGGGGGGVPPAPPPGTTDVRGKVSTAGVFLRSVTAISEDEQCALTIPEGTVGLTEELEPLTEITIIIVDEPPPPPEDAYVIGLAYDFGPDGATFDPPVTLTFSYDPADIPEAVAEEDLVIAYYDQATGGWVVLEGCVVDPAADTVTAPVAHLTAFRAMVFIPVPAAFSLSGLVLSPAEAEIGSPVTISAVVENTGGEKGTCEVTLKIDGTVEETKHLTLDPGASERVSFTTSRDVAGSYSVDVNELAGSFTVKEKPAPTAPPPEEVPPEVKPPVKWPLIGGIIGLVIAVGLLIFFLVRRRAY